MPLILTANVGSLYRAATRSTNFLSICILVSDSKSLSGLTLSKAFSQSKKVKKQGVPLRSAWSCNRLIMYIACEVDLDFLNPYYVFCRSSSTPSSMRLFNIPANTLYIAFRSDMRL